MNYRSIFWLSEKRVKYTLEKNNIAFLLTIVQNELSGTEANSFLSFYIYNGRGTLCRFMSLNV